MVIIIPFNITMNMKWNININGRLVLDQVKPSMNGETSQGYENINGRDTSPGILMGGLMGHTDPIPLLLDTP